MNFIINLSLALSSLFITTGIITDTRSLDFYGLGQDKTATVSLTELFANQEKYRDETILVKGKVVKVNPNIMGKNWIHVQDGTKNDEGEFHDLTITSKEMFEMDDEVIIKGKIILDKNFGSGYFYEVIMEEGESYRKKI